MIKAAVIGDPISHSLSPKLHGYFLNKYNIEGQYSAINVKPENLEKDFDDLLQKQGFAGFNATLPHKESLFKLCIHRGYNLTDSALACEAVNTIYRKNDQIWGSNSDAYGFIKNLTNSCETMKNKTFLAKTKKTALVIGAGGAAKSIVFALLNNDFDKIYIINRNQERAQNLINLYQKSQKSLILTQNIDKTIGAELDLIVNTTSLGMKNQSELKIDLTNLNKSTIVYDIVYNPLMTKLLQDAKSQGNPVVFGLGMLIFQALEGFEKWFKVKPELNSQDFEELVRILR